MAVQAVFFDFGGTLDSNGETWLNRFYPLYLQNGIKATRDEFARAFYASDDNLARRFDLAKAGLEETITLQVHCVLEALSSGRPDDKKKAAITRAFVDESRKHLCRAKSLLERLRPNYRLGIISNFYGNLGHILAAENFRGVFDVIADSGVVGHLKPESEIFEFAMDKIGSSPEDSWMVGDSLARDMKGAEAAGMKHAWLRGFSAKSTLVCCPEVRILSRLDDFERCCDATKAAA